MNTIRQLRPARVFVSKGRLYQIGKVSLYLSKNFSLKLCKPVKNQRFRRGMVLALYLWKLQERRKYMEKERDIDALAGERWFPKESSIEDDMKELWGDWGVCCLLYTSRCV